MLLNEADALPSLSAKHRLHRAVVAARFHAPASRLPRVLWRASGVLRTLTRPVPALAWHVSSTGLITALRQASRCRSRGKLLPTRLRATSGLTDPGEQLNCSWLLGLSNEELSRAIVTIGRPFPWHLSYLADLLVRRAHEIDPPALQTIEQAVQLHPASVERRSPNAVGRVKRTHSARNWPHS